MYYLHLFLLQPLQSYQILIPNQKNNQSLGFRRNHLLLLLYSRHYYHLYKVNFQNLSLITSHLYRQKLYLNYLNLIRLHRHHQDPAGMLFHNFEWTGSILFYPSCYFQHYFQMHKQHKPANPQKLFSGQSASQSRYLHF